jgi:hypothetical protein
MCDFVTAVNSANGLNRHVASPPTAGITKAFALTSDAATTLTCSFAGGCAQTVHAPGLKQSISAGQAAISVCGKPCVMDDANSDASQVKCHVPYMQSLASIAAFTIDAEGPITGDLTSSG